MVVRIQHCHYRGPGSVSGQGTEILQAMWYSQKKIIIKSKRGFLDSSVGKEFTCNAGKFPGSFPESGRSLGEGIGYPLQYSWASLVAQRIKNLLATWETQV